jgi:hypothetical protein
VKIHIAARINDEDVRGVLLSWLVRKTRVALASRQLFDNWYLLLAEYMLTKIGFNARLKAGINDCILAILPEDYERLINRYYED